MIRFPHLLVAVTFAALAVLAVLPYALNAYLPFETLPVHIARRYIAGEGAEAMAAFFAYDRTLGTDQAADLLFRLLPAGMVAPEVFARVTLGGASLLFVASLALMSRTLHSGWSLWPLVSGLLVLNAPLLWGFEDFVVTVPFAILGFTLWLSLWKRPLIPRIAAALAVSALLWLGSAFALFVYLILVIGHSIDGYLSERRVASMRLPEVAAVLAVGAWHLAASGVTAADVLATTRFGTLSERIDLIWAPFRGQTGESYGWFELSGMMLTSALMFFAVLIVLFKRPVRVFIHPEMRLPLLLLGLATLAMPAYLAGETLAHLRLPYVFLGVLLASIRTKAVPRTAMVAGALVLVTAMGVRTALFNEAARTYSTMVADLDYIAGTLEPGGRVLAVRLPTTIPATRGWHLAAYLIPKAQAFVPTMDTDETRGLRLAGDYRHLTLPQPLAPIARALDPANCTPLCRDPATGQYIPGWPEDYTHLLIMGTPPGGIELDWSLKPVSRKGIFRLYAVR